MEELFSEGILRLFCNLIGGTIRWIYGTVWRSLFKKPKFKYKEYVFGLEKSKNHYDAHGHDFNNVIVTIISIGILINIFIYVYK